MIARLRGKVWERTEGRLVIDVGGVGYDVLTAGGPRIPEIGEDADLFIRQVFREDDVSLYGFASAPARALFDLLTEVKGCGPKISLALLATLGEAGLVNAIAVPDPRTLAKANGVGPRLAERILVELRDKVTTVALPASANGTGPAEPRRSGVDAELVEALMALGYRRLEAETAAQESGTDATMPTADRVRAALRRLAK